MLFRLATGVYWKPVFYVLERRFSKHPERFGKGALDGKISSTNGNVVLDLRPIIDQIAQRLGIERRKKPRTP